MNDFYSICSCSSSSFCEKIFVWFQFWVKIQEECSFICFKKFYQFLFAIFKYKTYVFFLDLYEQCIVAIHQMDSLIVANRIIQEKDRLYFKKCLKQIL